MAEPGMAPDSLHLRRVRDLRMAFAAATVFKLSKNDDLKGPLDSAAGQVKGLHVRVLSRLKACLVPASVA